MENATHINVFDFDETLFRVPGYTSAEAKGMEPYEWFDSPQSLAEQFNIRGIQNTLDRTKDACHNMLVTHRVPATRPRVMEILSANEIRFDEVHFLGRGSQKAETVIDAIRSMQPASVTIFEDSLWEIICYTAYFLDAGLHSTSLDIVFYFIDKSKIVKIDWDTARLLEERAEVERLKIV
jgi:hypothetical protein